MCMDERRAADQQEKLRTVVWMAASIGVFGALFLMALTIRAFMRGALALQHSTVTAADQPFFFYVIVGGVRFVLYEKRLHISRA
ncbi:hypothetical protein [Ensifer aridi]|uniref:hypothetical protein n=1 Tax=Ensifer aridi TaxID=1708715 RepID=UPI00111C539B|nr:hypothetical protein [Ensifer aridi]